MIKIKPKTSTSEDVYKSSLDLIRQIDETLEMVGGWLRASDSSKEKDHWKEKANHLLDERLKAMEVRDRRKQ